MIKIIKELNIDVTQHNVFQAVVAKQYDVNSRFLKVTLTDCGNVVTIPYSDKIKAIINAERVDGQSKGFDGEVNEDGTVTVPLHSWMLELDGLVKCDISVIDTATDNNKKLTTTSFDLMVEKAAYGGEDVTTDPQYDVLVELIERVENIESGSVGTDVIYIDSSNLPQRLELETNKIYTFAIYHSDTFPRISFALPEVDNTQFNSIELQVMIKGYEKLTIDLGTTKYFGDIPELGNGFYSIYYEYVCGNWCVGALPVIEEP